MPLFSAKVGEKTSAMHFWALSLSPTCPRTRGSGRILSRAWWPLLLLVLAQSPIPRNVPCLSSTTSILQRPLFRISPSTGLVGILSPPCLREPATLGFPSPGLGASHVKGLGHSLFSLVIVCNISPSFQENTAPLGFHLQACSC